MQQHARRVFQRRFMIAVQGPNKRVLEVEAVSAFDRACAVLCYATWQMVDIPSTEQRLALKSLWLSSYGGVLRQRGLALVLH